MEKTEEMAEGAGSVCRCSELVRQMLLEMKPRGQGSVHVGNGESGDELCMVCMAVG